jgi:insertion element IS1 protein InsB
MSAHRKSPPESGISLILLGCLIGRAVELGGRRQDETCKKSLSNLKVFKSRTYYTDDWGSYSALIPKEKHVIGKINTQKIENKNLFLRTRVKRLTRKTICFSKSEALHDAVIGLFINRYCFESS